MTITGRVPLLKEKKRKAQKDSAYVNKIAFDGGGKPDIQLKLK